VSYEGVEPRWLELSLPSIAKAGFRIGSSSAGVELEWRFALFLWQLTYLLMIQLHINLNVFKSDECWKLSYATFTE
jgi:hypothetical protein